MQVMRPTFRLSGCPLLLGSALLAIALGPGFALGQDAAPSPGASLAMIEIDPDASATLNARDQVSVKAAYTAGQSVKIYFRPYAGGREVPAMSHASPDYAPGEGEAFGWFEVMKPMQVDEIRVKMTDARTGASLASISHPVGLSFTGINAPARERAEWAQTMGAAQQEAISAQIRAAVEQSSANQSGLATWLFGAAFMGVTLLLLGLGIGLPVWALKKWRGAWRMAACVPLAVFGFIVLRIVIDTSADPTSHNLWPFEVLIWGGGCTIAMAALFVMRAIVRRSASQEA